MLKKILILCTAYKATFNIEETLHYSVINSFEEGEISDTLVVTDNRDTLKEALEKNYAVLYISEDDSFVDGAAYITDSITEYDEQYLNTVFCRQRGIPVTILETKRTIVREITVDDLMSLYELYDDDMVRKYVEPLYPYEEEKLFTEKYIQNMYGLYGYGMWVVINKETGGLIGRAGLEIRNMDGTDKNEIGYIIKREYRNKGYAYEVCKAIMQYAFETEEMEDLLLVTRLENLPSCNLAEKLGFNRIGSSTLNGYEYMIFQCKG